MRKSCANSIKADAHSRKEKKSVSIVWCGARLNLHTITLSAAAAQNKWSRVHLSIGKQLLKVPMKFIISSRNTFPPKNTRRLIKSSAPRKETELFCAFNCDPECDSQSDTFFVGSRRKRKTDGINQAVASRATAKTKLRFAATPFKTFVQRAKLVFLFKPNFTTQKMWTMKKCC